MKTAKACLGCGGAPCSCNAMPIGVRPEEPEEGEGASPEKGGRYWGYWPQKRREIPMKHHGVGAVAATDLPFDPNAALNVFGPLLSNVIPGGDIGVSVLKTAAGVSTPVSPEDIQAFASLVKAQAELDAKVTFNPNAPAALKAEAAKVRARYSSFLRLWNAAQRDPNELRALLSATESLLSTAADLPHSPVSFPKPRWGKKALLLAGGAALVVVGGAAALVAGRH